MEKYLGQIQRSRSSPKKMSCNEHWCLLEIRHEPIDGSAEGVVQGYNWGLQCGVFSKHMLYFYIMFHFTQNMNTNHIKAIYSFSLHHIMLQNTRDCKCNKNWQAGKMKAKSCQRYDIYWWITMPGNLWELYIESTGQYGESRPRQYFMAWLGKGLPFRKGDCDQLGIWKSCRRSQTIWPGRD